MCQCQFIQFVAEAGQIVMVGVTQGLGDVAALLATTIVEHYTAGIPPQSKWKRINDGNWEAEEWYILHCDKLDTMRMCVKNHISLYKLNIQEVLLCI